MRHIRQERQEHERAQKRIQLLEDDLVRAKRRSAQRSSLTTKPMKVSFVLNCLLTKGSVAGIALINGNLFRVRQVSLSIWTL